jgi:L-ribulose-5-phosphate 3-epimerase
MFRGGELDAYGFPEACAELGIRELECLDVWTPSDEGGLARFEEAVKEAGCSVTMMTCGISLCEFDEGKRKEKVEESLAWVRIAHRLGARAMRIDLGWDIEDIEGGTKQVIKSWKEIVPRCEELGVVATMENHGGLTRTAENILRIIEGVGSKHLGTCPDFGNFKEEVRYESLAKLAPYAAQVHAKTVKLDEGGNERAYDYPRCVQIFKDAGYDGAWGIEFEGELEGATPDEKTGVRMSRELLERLL